MPSGRTEVQSMYLGPTGNVQSFNESLTDFPYPGMVGQMFRVNDRWFQLVQFHASAGSITAGRPCYWISTNLSGAYQVCTDPNLAFGPPAASSIGCNTVAGLIVGSPTAGNLGFIQKQGPSIVPVYSIDITRPGAWAATLSTGFITITQGVNTSLTAGAFDIFKVGVYRTSSAALSAVAILDLMLRNYDAIV